MAKKETTDTVEALVLRDCGFGKAGEVVTICKADAKTGVASMAAKATCLKMKWWDMTVHPS